MTPATHWITHSEKMRSLTRWWLVSSYLFLPPPLVNQSVIKINSQPNFLISSMAQVWGRGWGSGGRRGPVRIVVDEVNPEGKMRPGRSYNYKKSNRRSESIVCGGGGPTSMRRHLPCGALTRLRVARSHWFPPIINRIIGYIHHTRLRCVLVNSRLNSQLKRLTSPNLRPNSTLFHLSGHYGFPVTRCNVLTSGLMLWIQSLKSLFCL